MHKIVVFKPAINTGARPKVVAYIFDIDPENPTPPEYACKVLGHDLIQQYRETPVYWRAICKPLTLFFHRIW